MTNPTREVPVELLELLIDAAEHGTGINTKELMQAHALLAAPPADHSEQTARVYAIPVRDNGKRTTFYTETLPFVPGVGVEQIGPAVRMVAEQPSAAQVPDFYAGVKAASDHIKTMIKEYDEECGSTDPETGYREYPGNGHEWVGQMEELIEDFTGLRPPTIAAAPKAPEGREVNYRLVDALRTVVGMLQHKATTPLEREAVKMADAALSAAQAGEVKP